VQAGAALVKVTDERDELHQKHADALLALKAKGVPKDPKFIEAAAKVEALETALKDARTPPSRPARRCEGERRARRAEEAARPARAALDVNARRRRSSSTR
jgi:uncharacterized coiled-coil DUF342 family protein